MQEINIFYELFLSTEIWGYFGPLALIILGGLISKKDKFIGMIYFIVELLVVAKYFDLISTTPSYIWNAMIILLGGLTTICLSATPQKR